MGLLCLALALYLAVTGMWKVSLVALLDIVLLFVLMPFVGIGILFFQKMEDKKGKDKSRFLSTIGFIYVATFYLIWMSAIYYYFYEQSVLLDSYLVIVLSSGPALFFVWFQNKPYSPMAFFNSFAVVSYSIVLLAYLFTQLTFSGALIIFLIGMTCSIIPTYFFHFRSLASIADDLTHPR